MWFAREFLSFENQYISWVSNNQLSWTLNAPGMGSDPEAKISARPVPQEPMVCLSLLGDDTRKVHIGRLRVVSSRESGHVIRFWGSGSGQSSISRPYACGLCSSVSTEGLNKYWLRSKRLPNASIYQSVGEPLSLPRSCSSSWQTH